MQLILASSSQYRRDLLARLAQSFSVVVPDIDESALDNEQPRALAMRLATGKAQAAADIVCADSRTTDDCLIIGSDQVATLDGRHPIGKPGEHEKARRQLAQAAGKSMQFHTAVTVLRLSDRAVFSDCVDTTVTFRGLTDHTIETYLRAERPYDCAGAAKSEGLGISLIRDISGPDPTALVGLPLIVLTDLLAQAGHRILDHLTRSAAP